VILPHMHLVLLLMHLQKEALLAKSPKMRQLPVALQPMQMRREPPPMLLRLVFWRVDVWPPHHRPKVVKLLKLKMIIQLLRP